MAKSLSKEIKSEIVPEMSPWQQIDALKAENAQLRSIAESYEHDATYGLYFAMNRKGMEMAKMINAQTLSFTDGSFKTFIGSSEQIKDYFKVLETLKNDYLKKTDEALAAIEQQGTPLIEQRAEDRKKDKKEQK